MTTKRRRGKKNGRKALFGSRRRLAVFVTALLVICLSGAVLIDSLLSDDDRDLRAIAPPSSVQYSDIVLPAKTPAKPPQPVDPVKEKVERQAPLIVKKPEKEPQQLAHIPPVTEYDQKDQPDAEMPPWKEFAVATPLREGLPKIALVIDDVGLNGGRIDDLLQLPEIATIAFLPYAGGLQQKVDRVRGAGHEIMLHLPMEPTSKTEDPGPNALYKSYSKDEIIRLTHYNLTVFSDYVGVNNHMGSGFTTDDAAMDIVLNILREKGLLFLDSRTIGSSVGYELAKTKNIPTAVRDIFLDNVIEADSIRAQLVKTEALARANGTAIAIGHPHKLTLSILEKWMSEAVSRGFQFIPISMAVELNAQTVTN